MPRIYEYFGLLFIIYYEDHIPIHVHVKKAEFESKFELFFLNGKLDSIKEKRSSQMRLKLPEKDSKIAQKFIEKYYKGIADKWFTTIILKQEPKFEKITKKL